MKQSKVKSKKKVRVKDLSPRDKAAKVKGGLVGPNCARKR